MGWSKTNNIFQTLGCPSPEEPVKNSVALPPSLEILFQLCLEWVLDLLGNSDAPLSLQF